MRISFRHGCSAVGFTPRLVSRQYTGHEHSWVTRQVDVPEGTGTFELVVTSLPPQTVSGSLYSEGTDGVRVLTTRYRTQPIQEDTREEVRKIEAQLKTLQAEQQKLQSDIQVVEQNIAMLGKLEGFTGANLQHQTEKGTLNSEAIMTLSKYVMEGRGEKSQELVSLRQKAQDNSKWPSCPGLARPVSRCPVAA